MVWTVTVVIVALLTCVAVHEAAHALAARNLGIPIHRAGLGLPFPPTLTIARYRGVAYTLSPWLLGAYVDPHPDHRQRMDALPYRDRAWILNAGVVANVVFGWALLSVTNAVQGEWWRALPYAVAAGVWWMGRRLLAYAIVPMLSVPALGFVAWALFQSWSQGSTGMGYAAIGELVPTGLVDTIGFVGALSLALAVMNMLPLSVVDNGRVVEIALRRWLPRRLMTAYQATGIATVVVLLGMAVASDVWALLGL